MSQLPQSNNQVQYQQNNQQQPINAQYYQVPPGYQSQIPPSQYQQPNQQMVGRQQSHVNPPQPQVNQSQPQAKIPQILDNIEQLKIMYLENLCCYCTTYEIMWIICLILEYLGCQSLQAANLFISIQVFMLVASGLLYFVYTLANNTYKLIGLGAHAFFLILSYILNIAAFALSAKYPSFIESYVSSGCYYYVDELDTDYNVQVEYSQPAQYPILIMYIIQYFYSTFFLYVILRKDQKIYQYLRGLNQVANEPSRVVVQ